MANIIKELSNTEAYKLAGALDHFETGNTHDEYAKKVYITSDGKYHFSEGTDLHELVDMDTKVPAEALLLKQGRRQKKVLLPGKYIARKQVIKEYSREEILKHKDKIFSAYKAEQKALKEKLNAEAGEEGNPVQAITDALKKLSDTKKVR